MTDQSVYGKCKEMSELEVQKDPTLTLVRGYYHDAFWGKRGHWWTERPDGTIHDVTKEQFPDQNGEYEKFDGFFNCEQCGKKVHEDEVTLGGSLIFCSSECYFRCVL